MCLPSNVNETKEEKVKFIKEHYPFFVEYDHVYDMYWVRVGCHKYRLPFGKLFEFLVDFERETTKREEYLKARWQPYKFYKFEE